jgi:hypothetical protein
VAARAVPNAANAQASHISHARRRCRKDQPQFFSIRRSIHMMSLLRATRAIKPERIILTGDPLSIPHLFAPPPGPIGCPVMAGDNLTFTITNPQTATKTNPPATVRVSPAVGTTLF